MEYLNKTKFDKIIHFAFDNIEDETVIRRGLTLLKDIKHQVQIYVLIGFPKNRWVDKDDIERCQIIADAGFDPFVMVYNRKIQGKDPRMRQLNQFYRLVNRTYIWRKLGFTKAWETYR